LLEGVVGADGEVGELKFADSVVVVLEVGGILC
jgi:hypothetical protein